MVAFALGVLARPEFCMRAGARLGVLGGRLAQAFHLLAGQAGFLGVDRLALFFRQFRMPRMATGGASHATPLLTDGGVVGEIPRIAGGADEDHRTIGIIEAVNIVQLGLDSVTRRPPEIHAGT
jgi:hypothetical protein